MLKQKILLEPFPKCINKKLYEMYQDIPSKELGSMNKLYGVDYDFFLKYVMI